MRLNAHWAGLYPDLWSKSESLCLIDDDDDGNEIDDGHWQLWPTQFRSKRAARPVGEEEEEEEEEERIRE